MSKYPYMDICEPQQAQTFNYGPSGHKIDYMHMSRKLEISLNIKIAYLVKKLWRFC